MVAKSTGQGLTPAQIAEAYKALSPEDRKKVQAVTRSAAREFKPSDASMAFSASGTGYVSGSKVIGASDTREGEEQQTEILAVGGGTVECCKHCRSLVGRAHKGERKSSKGKVTQEGCPFYSLEDKSTARCAFMVKHELFGMFGGVRQRRLDARMTLAIDALVASGQWRTVVNTNRKALVLSANRGEE